MSPFDQQQLPLELSALAATVDDPTTAIQYALIDKHGERRVFGDQHWLAGLAHDPDVEIHQRTIAISYGEWAPSIPSESRSNP